MLYQISNKLDAGVSSAFYPIPCCLFIGSKWYEGFRSWQSCIKSKSTCFCLSDRMSCTEDSTDRCTASPFDFYCPSMQEKLICKVRRNLSKMWHVLAQQTSIRKAYAMPQQKKECLLAGRIRFWDWRQWEVHWWGWSNASVWQNVWNFQISIR